jgi:hypothetical protein
MLLLVQDQPPACAMTSEPATAQGNGIQLCLSRMLRLHQIQCQLNVVVSSHATLMLGKLPYSLLNESRLQQRADSKER